MQPLFELPEYRSHKTVRAAKIKDIGELNPGNMTRNLALEVNGKTEVMMYVPEDIIKKHDPVAGWYIVLYKDGYASFSPAEAFEEGYTVIK